MTVDSPAVQPLMMSPVVWTVIGTYFIVAALILLMLLNRSKK